MVRIAASIVIGSMVALASCGKQPPSPADEDAGPPPVADAGAGEDAGTDGGGAVIRKIVEIQITPAMQQLVVGNVSGLTAVATFDDSTTSDVTGSVTWTAEPAGIIEIALQDGLARIETLQPGTAQVTAKTGAIVSNSASVKVIPVEVAQDAGTANTEFRAVWVTRFHYNTRVAVESLINKAADAGFNVVFFQIRGNGDAYYKSALAPWAQKLTGTLGKDPGWDPLQTAIDAARARGIELHAYWNVFSGWPTPAGCKTTTCTCQPTQGLSDSCTLPPASPTGMPTHILREHPEYMAVTSTGKSIDQEYYWLSPGNPAVRARLIAEAEELLTKYDVDGLHLDRIRYPGSGYSFDAASNAAYAALPSTNKPTRADWQRLAVNETVEGIYNAVKAKRPNAVLSASVWGIYKKLPGCNTSEGYSGYFQDSIAWMKNGQIDALVPMIYWDIGTGCTDWSKLLDGFLAGANGRPVIAGMHALDDDIPQIARMGARIDYARTVGAAGTAIFASTYLDAKTSGTPTWTEQWSKFRAPGGPYVEDAGTPAIDWR